MSLSRIEVKNPDPILERANQDQGTVARFAHVNHVIDYLNGEGAAGDGSYKVYVALLTQTGTSAPTAVVLANTLGDIVWSRTNVGFYEGTLLGAFPATKTVVFCQVFRDPNAPSGFGITRNSDNVLGVVTTGDFAGASPDDVLSNSFIEIRVYN